MARQDHITTENRDELAAWQDRLVGAHALFRELGANATERGHDFARKLTAEPRDLGGPRFDKDVRKPYLREKRAIDHDLRDGRITPDEHRRELDALRRRYTGDPVGELAALRRRYEAGEIDERTFERDARELRGIYGDLRKDTPVARFRKELTKLNNKAAAAIKRSEPLGLSARGGGIVSLLYTQSERLAPRRFVTAVLDAAVDRRDREIANAILPLLETMRDDPDTWAAYHCLPDPAKGHALDLLIDITRDLLIRETDVAVDEIADYVVGSAEEFERQVRRLGTPEETTWLNSQVRAWDPDDPAATTDYRRATSTMRYFDALPEPEPVEWPEAER